MLVVRGIVGQREGVGESSLQMGPFQKCLLCK
jgi:hypothetical protein